MTARSNKRLTDVLILCLAASAAILFWLFHSGRLSLPASASPAGERRPPAVAFAGSGANALAEAIAFARLGPKAAGTHGARAAAEYISARLKAIGLEPSIDAFEESSPAGKTVFRNIEATIPGGSSNIVVLACHYDTKSGIGTNFCGANDSASGVGLALDLARGLFATRPHAATIVVAFLDGEECVREYDAADGLHGSRRMARRLAGDGRSRLVTGVFVLDMVGDRDLTVTIPPNSTPSLVAAIFEAAHAENARSAFSLHRTPILDDHVPFISAGMPAADVIDFNYGSRPGANDYWHTPQDTVDKLDARSLETVGRVVWRVITRL